MIRKETGERIKIARQRRGISRKEISEKLRVNISAVAAWETGRYLPRVGKWAELASVLGTNTDELFYDNSESTECIYIEDAKASRKALMACMRNVRHSIKILRAGSAAKLNSTYCRELYECLSSRLRNDEVEIRTVEICYTQERLRDMLINGFRFKKYHYTVKTLPLTGAQIFPCMDMYIFDDETIILCSCWTRATLEERPKLRPAGKAARIFLSEHWKEIWQYTSYLVFDQQIELAAFQQLGLRLGVPSDAWDRFVGNAERLATDKSYFTLI